MREYKTIATCVCVVRNEHGQFLFLQRGKNEEFGANQWDFPGGSKEFLETPEQAVLRECKEESGLDVHIEKFLRYKVIRGAIDPNVEFVSFLFLGKAEHQEVQISHEHQDYRWMSFEEAKRELDCVGWVNEFMDEVETGKSFFNGSEL